MAEIDDLAQRIIEKTAEVGSRLGFRFAIAVVDDGGFTISVQRATDGGRMTPSIALTKAYSAAAMGRPTSKLKALATSNPQFFGQVATLGMHPIVAIEGGFPIERDGVVLGALGISGGPAEADEEAAIAVLAELGLRSEF